MEPAARATEFLFDAAVQAQVRVKAGSCPEQGCAALQDTAEGASDSLAVRHPKDPDAGYAHTAGAPEISVAAWLMAAKFVTVEWLAKSIEGKSWEPRSEQADAMNVRTQVIGLLQAQQEACTLPLPSGPKTGVSAGNGAASCSGDKDSALRDGPASAVLSASAHAPFPPPGVDMAAVEALQGWGLHSWQPPGWAPNQWGLYGNWLEPFSRKDAQQTLVKVYAHYHRMDPDAAEAAMAAKHHAAGAAATAASSSKRVCGHPVCGAAAVCIIDELERSLGAYVRGRGADTFRLFGTKRAITTLRGVSRALTSDADVDSLGLGMLLLVSSCDNLTGHTCDCSTPSVPYASMQWKRASHRAASLCCVGSGASGPFACTMRIVGMSSACTLRSTGTKSAEKVKAILREGELESNTERECDGEAVAVALFSSIWGVGPTKAQQWASKGHRSIADVIADPDIMNTVNKRERAGLVHAQDLAQRIPRAVRCPASAHAVVRSTQGRTGMAEVSRTHQALVTGSSCGGRAGLFRSSHSAPTAEWCKRGTSAHTAPCSRSGKLLPGSQYGRRH